MSRLQRWPLPFNVVTGYSIINTISLLGWLAVFQTTEGIFARQAFHAFDSLPLESFGWSVIVGTTALVWILSLITLPICPHYRFFLRVLAYGLSIAWWSFCAAAISIGVAGLSTGTFVYAAFSIAGIYELLRTVRTEL